MFVQANATPREVVEGLGELHPLVQQLGSADGLVTLSAVAGALRLPRVDSRESLASFLKAYCAEVLLCHELPAICRAFHHASRNEVRELIAFGQALARPPALRDLAGASQRVGRSQLAKLRPLRGERLLQRYLLAVEEGRVPSWHTLVFGLTLALYSLPVRQGLMTYARQTLRGFVQAAARPLQLTRSDCQELIEELCRDLPQRLEEVVAQNAETPGVAQN